MNLCLNAQMVTTNAITPTLNIGGMRLCVLHNLYFYNNMMTEIRNALDEGNFASYKRAKLAGFEEYDKK